MVAKKQPNTMVKIAAKETTQQKHLQIGDGGKKLLKKNNNKIRERESTTQQQQWLAKYKKYNYSDRKTKQ